MPFWQAAAQIETMTGYRWASLDATRTQPAGLQLRFPSSFGGGADLNGAIAAQTPYFLIIGQSVSRSSNFEQPLSDAQTPAPKSSILLNLLAYTDPKVAASKSTLLNCRFQLGKNGAWTNLTAAGTLAFRKDPVTEFRVSLPSTLKPGTVISRLTGTYRTELVRELQTWKVADILATPTASETVAGTKLTLEGAKFEGDDLKVVVAFRMPEKGGPVMQDLAESILDAKVNDNAIALKLTDSAGQVLLAPLMGFKFGKPVDGFTDVKMTLTFIRTEKGGSITKGPVALSWSLPTLLRTYDVPFELKDLMVP